MMMLNRPTYISEPAQFNANVRYWHKADIDFDPEHVRYRG